MFTFVTRHDRACKADRVFCMITRESTGNGWIISTTDGGIHVTLHHEGRPTYIKQCFNDILKGRTYPTKYDRVYCGINPFILADKGF